MGTRCDKIRRYTGKTKDRFRSPVIRKNPAVRRVSFLCAFDLSGTQAARTYVYGLIRTVYYCLYPTDVGLPGSVGFTVGVGNGMTEYYTLAANFALCHL